MKIESPPINGENLQLVADFETIYARLEQWHHERAPKECAEYLKGIEFAEKQFRIIPFSSGRSLIHRTVEDRWSQLDLAKSQIQLSLANSRAPSSLALSVFDIVQNGKPIKVLETGLGAGISASEFDRRNSGGEIDAISLSPVNPYLRWKENVHDIDKNIEFSELSELTDFVPGGFVHRQFIGNFPREVILPSARYEFVHDQFGALTYSYIEPLEKEDGNVATRFLMGAMTSMGVLYVELLQSQNERLESDLCAFDPELTILLATEVDKKGVRPTALIAFREASRMADVLKKSNIEINPGVVRISREKLEKLLLERKI